MKTLDTIVTIDIVEPGLVKAMHKLSKELGYPLQGLVLTTPGYAKKSDRPQDKTGLFKEIICDFDDPSELQKALMPYTDRLLAVTCRYESSIIPYKKLIPFVPYLFAPTETSLLWATEKHLMRDRLRTYDESLVPKYVKLRTYDKSTLSSQIAGMSFPMIVKPSALAESLLVNEVKDEDELRTCLQRTFSMIRDIYERECQVLEPTVLVEEMMQGGLYSIDAYVNHKGEVFCTPPVKVIIAHTVGLPGFYSLETIVPAGLSEDEISEANKTAIASIRALNLRSTSTHIEMFYTEQGWKIIEVGSRIGGYREYLLREAYDIDHYYNDLLIHIGKDPIVKKEAIGNAIAINIYGDKEGIVASIGNFEEASKLPSIVYLKNIVKPGELSLFNDKGGVSVVNGILSNKDADALARDVAKVRELIKIVIEPKE